MCLKKFKPLSITIFLFTTIILLAACDNNNEISKTDSSENKTKLSFAEKARRAVESDLKINAAEEYDLQIHKAYIDRDTLEDAVILVNRKQWAHDRAEKQGNIDYVQKLGFTGPFNNVFVYLGKYDKFIPTPNVGSSADYPLEISFETISNPSQKDFFVDYRIRNSMHRNYYSVQNDRVFLTFNCPVFDSIGATNPRVYSIEHRESSIRLAKDIALYQGQIPNYKPSEIKDINNYTPDKIVSTGELYVFFIFDEKTMSYVTPMVNDKKEKQE